LSKSTTKKATSSANQKVQAKPLAIVGMACLFPEADSLDMFWQNLASGKDCITDLPETHWKAEDYFDSDPKAPDKVYTTRGGYLPQVDFNPLEYGITPNAIESCALARRVASPLRPPPRRRSQWERPTS